MAWARKCDRCGKLFDNQYNTNIDLITSSNENRNVKFDCGLNADLDLCPECIESFEHWWANETIIPITKKRGKNDGSDRKTT